MRRILRITLGIVLIILGIAAALTPFSPGSWLALIGLEILGLRLLFQRKLLSWTPRKYRDRLRNLLKKKKVRKDEITYCIFILFSLQSVMMFLY